MTVHQFFEKYYLHDSVITKVNYLVDKQILQLEIEFCFWMQDWYDKNKPTNGLIQVTINNVSFVKYNESKIDPVALEMDIEILDVFSDGNSILISTINNDINNHVSQNNYSILEINILSNMSNIEVKELARYNL